ncbi:hypothetical protein SRHO_G00139780 [Serrasalmus rhombeus]
MKFRGQHSHLRLSRVCNEADVTSSLSILTFCALDITVFSQKEFGNLDKVNTEETETPLVQLFIQPQLFSYLSSCAKLQAIRTE